MKLGELNVQTESIETAAIRLILAYLRKCDFVFRESNVAILFSGVYESIFEQAMGLVIVSIL